MGGADFGLSDDEMQKIVTDWRNANPNIVNFWWEVDAMVRTAIRNPGSIQTMERLAAKCTRKTLMLTLPSGRVISYWEPRIDIDPATGRESITYMSTEAGQWLRVETYGPKLVENVVQATARDCLRDAMLRVAEKYPDIVMHVHDEMVVEVPRDRADEALQEICEAMGKPLPWAGGLLLRGDGYLCDYYRKD